MGDLRAPDAELLARLRLALTAGVGPRIFRQLLARYGDAVGVLRAPPSELREISGVGPKLLRSLAAAELAGAAEKELALCRAEGIAIHYDGQEGYPRPLVDLPDPPAVLFSRGDWQESDAVAVAIVGTRHSTHYGDRQAERLAYTLSQAGFTIVSGLARGIDAAAHRGALAAGGRTIAVLATGVREIYPPEHKNLADDIARHGAAVSEAPSTAAPLRGVFPQRNRIISGLSLGVIVVEAPLRSGALSTADHALEQGREVFAVPGRVDDTTARGCHKLLRNGAVLCESADDVLEALGPLAAAAPRGEKSGAGPEVRHPAELKLGEQERQVLGAIRDEPTSLDEVATVCDLPVPRVLATVSVLEMRRLVKRVSGNTVMRLYAS